jgi:hypothetical protein
MYSKIMWCGNEQHVATAKRMKVEAKDKIATDEVVKSH